MKKMIFLVFGALLALAALVYAEGNVFSTMGYLESEDYVFVSDTAVTLKTAFEAAGRTWVKNGQPPKAITIQPETYGIRIGFNKTPSVDNACTVITAGSTGRWSHPDIRDAKICNSTTGANAKVHMIVER